MAEAIAVDIASSLLGKVLSLVADEVIQAWGFKENLEQLRQRMEMVQALLSDADKKQTRMEILRVWLDKLRGVALVAEDLMDELAYHVSRHKADKRLKVRDFISFSRNSILYRFNMSRKIKNVNSELDLISKWARDSGLNPADNIGAIVQQKEIRYTSPFLGHSKIIGRDTDVSKVVEMLCQSNENENLTVVAVVGLGGLGKTTLARQVYNHPETSLFQEKVWVTVSDDFDVIRILNEMIEFLFKESSQFKSLGAIVGKLQEKLKEKMFLLVLDDVWNEDSKKWDDLRDLLLGIEGARGSIVLVTTRTDKVVEAMQTPLCHQLVGLSEDDSWVLFKQRAFANDRVFVNKEIETIGKRMVKKCGGLPLAIQALGGLLYSKNSEQEWLSIENNKSWIPNEVLSCLRITYDHLTSLSLKKCFSYCCIFPKYVIEKVELIQIWMALGSLLPPRGNDFVMEDVGNEYFHTLLWNSLLQDVEVDNRGNITRCKMHDLVYDLALDVLAKYLITIKVSDIAIDISEAIYVKLEAVEGVRPKTLKGNVGRVKSLHVDNVLLGNLLGKFEHLTVLVLSSSDDIKELPSSIRKLKYLKYLDISKLEYIRKLPDFITTLYNLQTLRVFSLEELPKNFGNLINMRHIHFSAARGKFYEPDKLCWFIGIERMTCLQTLPFFVVSQDKGCHLKELGGLDKLGGELHIAGLGNVANMEDVRKARLCRKSNMRYLVLNWREWNISEYVSVHEDEYNYKDVMEGLKPHAHLKELEIVNFMGEMFASWMMITNQSLEILHNLVKIKFTNCNNSVQLPPLGHLPKLEELEINGMRNVEFIGTEFYGCPETVGAGSSTQIGASVTKIFPSLRKLKMIKMEKLVKWSEAGPSISADVFSCLAYCHIEGCSNLEAIPSHFQMVKELEIRGAKSIGALGELNSVTSIQLMDIKGGEEQLLDVDKLWENNKSSLRKLYIERCDVFSCLRLGNMCVGLEELRLWECPNVTSIIISNAQQISLKTLHIYACNALENLPTELLQFFSSLENLAIMDCPSLLSLPELSSPTLKSLKRMWIGPLCKELDHIPAMNIDAAVSDYSFSSLEVLTLMGWPRIKSLSGEWLQQLSFPVLRKLELKNFYELEVLPEWLGNLSSLESLYIRDCKKVVRFPDSQVMQRLRNLQWLTINGCPLLKESGAEWIARMPNPRFRLRMI